MSEGRVQRRCGRNVGVLSLCAGVLLGAGMPLGGRPLQAQSAMPAPASPAPVTEAATLPVYDVISVKPDKSDSGNVNIDIEDDNLTAINASLKMMIEFAYGLKDDQVSGLPKWGDTMRFDIRAKISDPDKKAMAVLTPEQREAIQRPILTDRFQLKFHREMQVLPVYELVVSRDGPKFGNTTAAEMASDTGVNGLRAGGVSINNGKLTATGVPMSRVADSLSGQLRRMVVDKTGLTGKYNLQLSWTREDSGAAAQDPAAPPGLFTAVQEQLGLKLIPSKASIETLVVDSAAIPTAD